MKHLRSPLKKPAGFTLIELMIAITISVILLNGVLQIFQSSKQSYRIADNLGRVQENARYALDVLAREIRQVGFIPCRRKTIDGDVQNLNTLNLGVGEDLAATDFFTTPLFGYEGGISAFPADFQAEGTAFGTRLAGSDAFRILRGAGATYSVANDNPAAATPVACTATECNLSSAHSLEQGDTVLICSTEGAAITQLNAVVQAAPSSITFNANIEFPPLENNKQPPSQGSQVIKLSSSLFYVGASLATDGNALTTNSLYRRDMVYENNGSRTFGPAQELVQGIETMQVIYGVALTPNGSAVRYVTADNVAAGEWNNVVSARIGLLFHTPEEISNAADSTSYNVVGTTVTPSSGAVAYPADRRQRYIFTETIKIRNRGASVAMPIPPPIL